MKLLPIDQAILNYLFDARHRAAQHAGYSSRRTIKPILAHVNKIRAADGDQPYTSAGPIRRSLDILVSNGLVTKHGKRPITYRYADSSVTPPKGYQSPVTTTQTTAPSRRIVLEKLVRDKRDEILGQHQTTTPVIKPAVTPITRPNGQKYYPRAIAGMADVEFLRQLRDSRIWPLLSGPPGTGKTSMIEAAFAGQVETQENVILITGDENTSFDDLFGTWAGNGDGNWEWVDGPATQAMKEGLVLFIDDITLISPLVLATLYPIMDGRDEVIIKTHMTNVDADGATWADGLKHQEIVKAHEGFFLVAAYNPATPGAILAPALASRFKVHLEVSSDFDLAQNSGVPVELVKVAKTLDTMRRENRIGWSPQMRELFDAAGIAKKFGMEVAMANLAGIPDDEDTRLLVLEKIKAACGTGMQHLQHLSLGKQM